MSRVILDDHLLRDLLAGGPSTELADVVATNRPATTNLYYLRLCKSVVSARGSALTGSWAPEARRQLGRALVTLPDDIEILPMRTLAFRMAELAGTAPLSALGAEAIAAAESLQAPLCVWDGDDGPHIRAVAAATGIGYTTIPR